MFERIRIAVCVVVLASIFGLGPNASAGDVPVAHVHLELLPPLEQVGPLNGPAPELIKVRVTVDDAPVQGLPVNFLNYPVSCPDLPCNGPPVGSYGEFDYEDNHSFTFTDASGIASSPTFTDGYQYQAKNLVYTFLAPADPIGGIQYVEDASDFPPPAIIWQGSIAPAVTGPVGLPTLQPSGLLVAAGALVAAAIIGLRRRRIPRL